MNKSSKNKWTTGSIHNEALKFKYRSDFKKGNPSAYNAACDHGVLKHVCSHMLNKYSSWTNEALRDEALKYTSRVEFQKCSSAYRTAHARGILDDICSHMKSKIVTWNREIIHKEAVKYNTRNEFAKGSTAAYDAAHRNDILDDVCSHMQNVFYWTNDLLHKAALDYKTRSEFQNKNPPAYKAARIRNILDSVCEHMIDGTSGFKKNKPAVVYCIVFNTSNNKPVYKIGVTNRSAKIRLQGMQKNVDIKATILSEISFDKGSDALFFEKSLHNKFKKYRYFGSYFIGNGFTELYTRNILSIHSS